MASPMEGGYPCQTFLLRGMLEQPIKNLIKLDLSPQNILLRPSFAQANFDIFWVPQLSLRQKQLLSQLTLVLMVSRVFNSIFYFHLLFRSSAVEKCVCNIQINIIVLCIWKLDFYLQGQCRGKVKIGSSLRLRGIFFALSFTDNKRPSSSKKKKNI